VIAGDLLEAAHVIVLQLGFKFGLLAQVTQVQGLDVTAMLHAKFRNFLPVLLFLKVKLVLKVVDLQLEVQADFLHSGFKRAHFLLLEFYNLFLLETNKGFHHLVWGQLHGVLGLLDLGSNRLFFTKLGRRSWLGLLIKFSCNCQLIRGR
jgi:hypothetical protein